MDQDILPVLCGCMSAEHMHSFLRNYMWEVDF
jgi:hypothetical protein